MGGRIHALAQQLTGKTTIEECSLDEIQHIANRHPYFAPAQFLLLQKLRQTGANEAAEKQYQKAVLFFHDPLQFEHFISSDKFLVDNGVFLPAAGEQTLQNDTVVATEEQQFLAQADSEVVEIIPDETAAVIEPPAENTIEPVNEEIATGAQEEEELIEPLSLNEEMPDQKVPDEASEKEVVDTIAENDQQEQPAPSPTPVSASSDLAFEPFHTVDYFASQGIKISQEELPKDKLGKQLKSFTEWLKTMKRLPAAQMEQSVESSAEKNVESMASHSVTESSVVTEAMAEVWLKQGNKAKALDIYNKLSLLNPSKKAYFAAKIENLKPS